MNWLGAPRSRRNLGEWAVLMVYAYAGYFAVGPDFEDWFPGALDPGPLIGPNRASWLSSAVGIFVSAALAKPVERLFASRHSHDYAAARARPGLVATACTGSFVIMERFIAPDGPPGADLGWLVWTVAPAALVWMVAYAYLRGSRAVLLDRVLEVTDPEDATELVGRCRRALTKGPLSSDRHAAVSLTLAGALIARSVRPGHEDALAEALLLLDAAAADAAPETVFNGALRMVRGMRAKALRTGDTVGYEHALAILAASAHGAADAIPAAPGLAHAAHAQRLADQAERLPQGDPAQARLGDDAVGLLDRAVAATPRKCPEHWLHVATRAQLSGHFAHDDLDQAVRDCRIAVRRLRRKESPDMPVGQLALADLLEMRAAVVPDGDLGGVLDRWAPWLRRLPGMSALWPDRAGNDLARAMLLCFKVMSGGKHHAPSAAQRMPRLRTALMEHTVVRFPNAILRRTGGMYRRAVEGHMEHAPDVAAELCVRWLEWSEEAGDRQQAAMASWCWVVAFADDLRRRVLQDKERRIADAQGRFVDMADHLALHGRTQEAAIVLDFGRAVLLCERMFRAPAGVEERLVAAGEHDLAARWRGVIDDLETSDRVAMTGDAGIMRAPVGLASPEYFAVSQHQALLRDIGAIPGFEDVAVEPDYPDIRGAALDGPLVYIGCRDTHGLALVVTTSSTHPVAIRLPLADRATIAWHAATLRAADGPEEIAEVLRTLLPALWETVMAWIVPDLPPQGLVTLVPIGDLAELPLHMAGVAPDATGIWRDRTEGLVFRYSPNARVLARAQETAASFGRDLRALTVAVPAAPGRTPLPHAEIESHGVQARFGAATVRPVPATVDRVRDALEATTVWHFACHGTHDPVAPQRSMLQLADGPLQVRALFSERSRRRRLAVLSACHTTNRGDTLPDEVISFPSAMLQAGVAGVVSCLHSAQDDAATLLVLDFVARFDAVGSPAHALAASQAWLRTATNAELDAAYPGVLEPRDDGRWTGYRPFADPCTWALFNFTGA